MSQPFKLRYQNEIVGVFVLASVAVVFATLLLMARSRQLFESTFECSIRFDTGNVALISDGMEVRIRSQVVGRIIHSEYDNESRVVAHVALNTRHRKAIHRDSVGVLYTPLAGLPGEPFIELKGGKHADPVAIGGILKGRAAEDLLQLATDVLTDTRLTLRPTLTEVEKLTRRLNGILDTLAPAQDLPTLTKRLTALLDRVERVLARADKLMVHGDAVLDKIDKGDGLVAKMLSDPKLIQQVMSMIVRVQSAAVSIERTLVTADRVAATAHHVLGKTDKLIGLASGGLRHLPDLMKSGKRALNDMLQLTTELKRIAPKVPGLMTQIDDVLLETRSIMSAAERHWLLNGTLRPKTSPKPLPGRGLRDAPPLPSEATLRRMLGGSK